MTFFNFTNFFELDFFFNLKCCGEEVSVEKVVGPKIWQSEYWRKKDEGKKDEGKKVGGKILT
jgi:hypothetical protein